MGNKKENYRDYENGYNAWERYQAKRKKEKYEVREAGPDDLTYEKIHERMKKIRIGDKVTYDSQKEAYLPEQVDRHSATIKATAQVVEHCGGYLMVRLHGGVMESVTYFDIETVNGRKWPGYISKPNPQSSNASEENWRHSGWL